MSLRQFIPGVPDVLEVGLWARLTQRDGRRSALAGIGADATLRTAAYTQQPYTLTPAERAVFDRLTLGGATAAGAAARAFAATGQGTDPWGPTLVFTGQRPFAREPNSANLARWYHWETKKLAVHTPPPDWVGEVIGAIGSAVKDAAGFVFDAAKCAAAQKTGIQSLIAEACGTGSGSGGYTAPAASGGLPGWVIPAGVAAAALVAWKVYK